MASSAASPPPFATKRSVDLAFAIDCTGSMGSYIQQAQENVRQIAEEIVSREKVNLRLALVEYRDHPPQETTFVTNVLDFTTSLQQMKARLDLCAPVGGGDAPEAVADALHAVLKLSWREGVTKICVFIADAPPHGLGCPDDGFASGCPSGLDPMVTAGQLAKAQVVVYTVGCEPSITPYRDWFMAISQITGGQYVPLGSAKLLSQVIIGGTLEELSLSGLMNNVSAEVEKLTLSGKSQQEIELVLYDKLKGSKTKQVRTNTGALMAPTDQAKKLSELRSMEAVRLAFVLATTARSSFDTPCSSSRGGSGDDSIAAPASAAPAAAAFYKAEDTDITMSQISRMVYRSMNSKR